MAARQDEEGGETTPDEADQIADAIRDHYKPLGPSDTVPTAPVTVAVALADKLDTLVGFFAIDERPTGSRDPYALRRAALGVIRLLLTSNSRLSLKQSFKKPIAYALARDYIRAGYELATAADRLVDELGSEVAPLVRAEAATRFQEPAAGEFARTAGIQGWRVAVDVVAFFADRLKVLLREEGKRHDLVDAVFALGDDDLVRIVSRVDALDRFLQTEDGASLLAGYKRAVNILKAEAKKHPGEDYDLNPQLGAMTAPEEMALQTELGVVEGEVDRALEREDFEDAMRRLSHLRAPVDAFFDKVLVNDADPATRLNRLRLLSQVRGTANRIADFSLVSG